MFVNEIFQSIDGEGSRAGSLVTFVRLCRCNLRCSYCDTTYAFSTSESTEMTVKEIVEKVKEISIGNLVTLTGGEPLIHVGVDYLIYSLMDEGFEVNVETNGSVVPRIPSKAGKLFYTMDMKCPSSGESSKMSHEAYSKLTALDVLKFVVGSTEDLDFARRMLEDVPTNAEVYFSPVFGKIEPKAIVEYLQKYKMFPCKVQLQMHKFIWPVDMRGV